MQRRTTHSSPLLTPYAIGNVSLRNRIVSTAHSTRYTLGGIPTERYRLYQEEKAKGGVGLITIGGSAVVSRDSAPAFGNITMYTDEVIDPLAKIVDSCHRYGSKVFIQLTHLGRRTDDHSADWLPTVSSVSLREPAHRSYPKSAEPWDLDRITNDFVSAARRAKQAGVDGIELEHYGHLLDAFISPWHLQHLSAEQQLEAVKWPVAVIQAVKQVTGDELALGVRMSVDERRQDGLQFEKALQVLQQYIDAGIDFVNVVVGTIEAQSRMTHVIPGAGKSSAPFLNTVKAVKDAVNIPVIHAAKIDEVATAEHAVEGGFLDLVGMTRVNIADPYFVQKVQDKETESIRPCVGARLCLEAGSTGGVVCFHNPAVGREQFLSHEITQVSGALKHIVIVGAGPGGLEAARVASRRGHRVTILEAASEPGGQLATVRRLQRKRDYGSAIDWRVEEAQKHGAVFHFDTFVDASDVLALNPDIVVLATGGLPREAADVSISGAEHIHSIWEVFERPHLQLNHAVLFDDEGRNSSLDALEILAKNADRVTYITPERSVGIDVGTLNFADYAAAIEAFDVRYRLNQRVTSVSRNSAGFDITLTSESGATTSQMTADHVFYAGGTWPNSDLYEELQPVSINKGEIELNSFIEATAQPMPTEGLYVYRIGDAVSSRTAHAAFLDAQRLLQSI